MTNLAYQDAPGIGHNAPPSDNFQAIKGRADALAETANAWLGVKAITDLETAEACDSFLAQVRAELKAADKDRKAINEPHDKAVKANNDRFRGVTALLMKCEEMLAPLKAGWLKREAARIAADKAEREMAAKRAMQEAEDARKAAEAAAAPTVQAALVVEETAAAVDTALKALAEAERARPVVKGGLAARASGLRQYWFAKIHDYQKALHHYGLREEVQEVVQRLANADARERKDSLAVPGVQAKMEERA